MSEEIKKPRKHLHIGALVLVVILVILLFKVNLEDVLNSPRFNNNVAYIEKKGKNLWELYLSKPILYIWNNLFSNAVLKLPSIDQSEFDKFIEAPKIKDYFGNTDKEKWNSNWSTPVSNQ